MPQSHKAHSLEPTPLAVGIAIIINDWASLFFVFLLSTVRSREQRCSTNQSTDRKKSSSGSTLYSLRWPMTKQPFSLASKGQWSKRKQLQWNYSTSGDDDGRCVVIGVSTPNKPNVRVQR